MCNHSSLSKLTHQSVNTRGAVLEKEGTCRAPARFSCPVHKVGVGRGVFCAGSSPNVPDSDMGCERKGFSIVWQIFTNTGSTDVAVCQGDARTRLRQGWGQDRSGDVPRLQVLGSTEREISHQYF